MCGIFGIFSKKNHIAESEVSTLAKHAQERGSDSSGLMIYQNGYYKVLKGDTPISRLIN